MAGDIEVMLREQLLDRRHKLQDAIPAFSENAELGRLLHEVDAALERMDTGVYGLCEACHEPIENDRLIADPLARLCLDHLTPTQQRVLEEDLELASKIQKGLLPKPDLSFGGWEIRYHYEPAGIVSGDYCDLITSADGELYFILGDVTGKGVAASMLMVHLHAMFRSLILVGLSLQDLLERASRVFCESTLPTHYATLVCGKASGNGEIEICNAGHLPPVLIRGGVVTTVEASSLPVGVFCDQRFASSTIRLSRGDTLLLYTDGLSETQDPKGNEYGRERLSRLIAEHQGSSPAELIRACLDDLSSFRGHAAMTDDLTIMVVHRTD